MPVYETLAAVRCLPDGIGAPGAGESAGLHFVTAGEEGILKLWNQKGSCLWTQEAEVGASVPLIDLAVCHESETVLAIRGDHNLCFYDARTMDRERQLVGFNDEILDLCLTPGGKEVVLASNSEQVRVFNCETFTCEALCGHTDIVLCVDVSHDGRYIVSSGKDHTVRVWDAETTECLAVGTGHNEAVGAVCWPRKSNQFVLSGSKDRTIKMWDLKGLKGLVQGSAAYTPGVKHTEVAHAKDINCIACAPNDGIFATASQDKLIKLWNTADMKLRGSLKGHKRGVWSIEFSPVDKALASASADTTIKIWSATDFSCLKTLEGHTASVLKVSFLTAGMQLVSVGGDGLVKLWTIKTAACENTFDEHEDKIWALACREGRVVTGGADSLLFTWKDVTTAENEEAIALEEEKVLQNQELEDAQRAGDYVKAAQLALRLDHPYQLMKLIEEILGKDRAAAVTDANAGLCSVVRELDEEELVKTLGYIRDWNCVAKFSIAAQRMLHAVFTSFPPQKLKRLEGFKELLEALLPYSERHMQRVSTLLRGSYFVDYVVNSMALTQVPEHEVAIAADSDGDDSAGEGAPAPPPAKRKKR